ncbi:MAG: ribosomal L7Ae/L30e/S12e/Gadd45 family protein [Phascolarctobacterium sp.]|nr:ribosomal L7Ae/L30e/S12e/Gadd45 family protein [Phascolarctobacterium sp.]
MASNKASFALGLAQKAGKAMSGDVAVRGALKSGKTQLLIIATDAAEATKKELYFLAQEAKVETIELLTRAELGFAMGKAPRAAVAIMDINFAKMLRQ